MNENNVDMFVKQLKQILLGQHISEDLKCKDPEFLELQEGFDFLEKTFLEANEFLYNLTLGNLDIAVPNKHSVLANKFKELHSILSHISWQANQVANGDYNHNIKFLGDFSASFNKMVEQLALREAELKNKSALLSKNLEFFKEIMDTLNDLIIVTLADTGEIIYKNYAAKYKFFGMSSKLCLDCDDCTLFKKAYDGHTNTNSSETVEFTCDISKCVLKSTSYPIFWEDNPAFLHTITDITKEKEEQNQIETIAYKDELTKIYNRRFCIGKLEKMLNENINFSVSLFDIDGLKFANDNFGHNEGDLYITTIVSEVKKLLFDNEIFCRLGGDEFIIISETRHSKKLNQLLEVVNSELSLLQKDYPMSISYGSLNIIKNHNFSYVDILEEADEYMYEMKKAKKFK